MGRVLGDLRPPNKRRVNFAPRGMSMSALLITIQNWLDFIFACPLLAYRLFRYGYTYRRIYLGEGKWTILEQADYYRLKHYKWIVYGTGNGGQNLYAIRFKLIEPYKTTMVSMHREIMNAKDERLVDHRNCNSLDNRKSNLRFATRAENMRNRRKKRNATSQYLGVHYYKPQGTWSCAILHNGKRIWLGRFVNEIDAAKTHDVAAKKYHREFARLNFPEKEESRPLQFCFSKLYAGVCATLRAFSG
jgi:hypothetical protein